MPFLLPGLLVAFTTIAIYMAFTGMHQGSNTWLRTLLEEYSKPRGGFIKRAVTSPLRAIARGVLRVERWVRAALASALLASELAVVGWLHGLADLAIGIGREIEDLGKGIEEGIVDLTKRWIPRHVESKVSPVRAKAKAGFDRAERARVGGIAERKQRIAGIDRLRGHVDRDAVRPVKGIEEGIRTNVKPRIKANERAVGRVRSRDLPVLRDRARALERAVYGKLSARLSRVEKLLGLGVISAVVIRTLAKVAPWLFCRNVSRLGRTVCGLNPQTMNALTALLLGALAISDLRTLVRLGQSVEEEAVQELRRLLGAE